MRIQGCFSKKSDLWRTPSDLYNKYMNEGFFDPCPPNPKFDGLKIDWKEKNFVNPPYSQIKLWIEKGLLERERALFSILATSENRYKMVC